MYLPKMRRKEDRSDGDCIGDDMECMYCVVSFTGIYSDKNTIMDCAAGVFFRVAYFPSTVQVQRSNTDICTACRMYHDRAFLVMDKEKAANIRRRKE